MKILYFTGQLIIRGGIERVLTNKMNYLARFSNHEVFLVTYEQRGCPFVFEIDPKIKIYDLGVNYNVDYTCEKLFSWKFIKKVPNHISKTRSILRRIKPDIIIIPNFGYEFYFLPFITKIPIIREFHDSQYRRLKKISLKKNIFLWIENIVLRKYAAIVVLNESEKLFFDKTIPLFVIPNPVELCKRDAYKRKNIVIAAGRLNPVKGYDKLLNVWAKIPFDIRKCWTLKIFGDGDSTYKLRLIEKAKSLGIIDSVLFCDSVNDIFSQFLEAKIFVCTSETESFGMVLVEAESCGLPVISFDCPTGPRHIISQGKDGFLISAFSVEEYVTALQSLMINSDILCKMSLNATDNSKKFSIQIVMEKWLNLFDGIVNSERL